MNQTVSDLPFIDEHQVIVSAPASAVWQSLTRQIPQFANAGRLARVLATEPRKASGQGVSEGSTFPGFEVAQVVPGHGVVLTGRHRFSRYALTFTVAERPEQPEQPSRTMLSARTEAVFPGPHGWVYKQLVIGSGVHAVLVTRLLRQIRNEAERERG